MSKFKLNENVYPIGRSDKVGRVVRIETSADLLVTYSVCADAPQYGRYTATESELRHADTLPKTPWHPQDEWREDFGRVVWFVPEQNPVAHYGRPRDANWPWFEDSSAFWVPLP